MNDKVTDRTRLLFLNNVTSYLYVTSLLLFYTLFFLVITMMYPLILAFIISVIIVLSCIKNVVKPSLLMILLCCWECVHSSAFYVAFSLLFSSPYLSLILLTFRTLAVSISIIINAVAAVPFLYVFQLNSFLVATIFPGGAYSLFLTQSLLLGGNAFSLIVRGLVYSVLSTIIYAIACYVILWLREDVLNVMDRVCVNGVSNY